MMFTRFVIPFLGVLYVGWLLWEGRAPVRERILRLLQRDRYERAFRIALRDDHTQVIKEYLDTEQATPSESLRVKLVAAYSELRVLHVSVHDRANVFVNQGLKKAMQESSDAARRAFWDICINLKVVARQKVRFAEDHPKIKRLNRLLEQLAESTGLARVKLAELSLGANEREIQEAKLAIEDVRRQSEALLEVDRMLEE